MIPFNYNFSTKEVSNFVEKIKFVHVSWRNLPELYSSKVKIQSINGNLIMIIPVEYLVDVTIMKYTVTNTGREFIALRGKIKGITIRWIFEYGSLFYRIVETVSGNAEKREKMDIFNIYVIYYFKESLQYIC